MSVSDWIIDLEKGQYINVMESYGLSIKHDYIQWISYTEIDNSFL